MNKINEKQNKINNSISNYNFFNPDGYTNLKREFSVPLDTLNDKSNHAKFNTTKATNTRCNPLVEEDIRNNTNPTNFNSQLFSLNNNLAKYQQENNVFFKELNKTNSNAFINVDEKLKFNNHSRLY